MIRSQSRRKSLRERQLFGDPVEADAVDQGQEDVRVAAAVRGVGDRAGVGRPARRDVQLPVGRDPPLVGAVVIRDVDLLHFPVLHRADHPLAIPDRRGVGCLPEGRGLREGQAELGRVALVSDELPQPQVEINVLQGERPMA